MRKEVIKQIVHTIMNDFENILVDELSESSSQFPYTNACISFIIELQEKGISTDFDAFDQEIIDYVYRELVTILVQ